MSEFGGITNEDAEKIKAIVKAFYGAQNAERVTKGNISDKTVHYVALLLIETVDCSRWVDAVPNPKDLLMPAKSIQKWALRLIRNAGKPFVSETVEINVMCKNFRAAQFKPNIMSSLIY